MKKILMGFVVLTIFALSIALFQISCKKEAMAQANTTLTKTQILAQKVWKLDELHSVINGVYASYYNGGTNTTGITYDNLRYTFNADGTGTYVNENSISYPVTWQFASVDQRTITFTIHSSTPDNWQMVEIAGNYLHATENFTIGSNTNNMHSFRLVQIP